LLTIINAVDSLSSMLELSEQWQHKCRTDPKTLTPSINLVSDS